jgi:hypothetical protein
MTTEPWEVRAAIVVKTPQRCCIGQQEHCTVLLWLIQARHPGIDLSAANYRFMLSVTKSFRSMLRSRMGLVTPLTVIAGVFIALAIVTWYYRWANFSHKPLFYNTYGPSSEGLGTWHWSLEPWWLADGKSYLIFVDFSLNELAVVNLPEQSHSAFLVVDSSPNRLVIRVGLTDFILPKSPDTLLLINKLGSHTLHPLKASAARIEYTNIEKDANAGIGESRVTRDR